jgi:hypothetical protein
MSWPQVRPAARDGHLDVFSGEGVGESLAYRTESYNRIAHNTSPICVDIDSAALNGVGLSVSLHGDLREIFGPPPQAMRVIGSTSCRERLPRG